MSLVGDCVRLSPLVASVLADNPSAFTFTGTQTFLVGALGDDSWVIIDPGPNLDSHVDNLLAALNGRNVSHILLTHRHHDHAGLAARLAQHVGAPICAADASTHPIMAEDGQVGHGPDVDVDIILREGDTVAGLSVLATPGHCGDHLGFALADEATLFCGDHVMDWASSVLIPPDGQLQPYLDSLQKVLDGGYQVLRPTHGPAIGGMDGQGAAIVAQKILGLRDHRLARDAQILTCLSNGPKRIVDIVGQIYHAHPRHLWPAASLSVWAHLLRQRDFGVVKADGAADLASQWCLN